MVSLWPVDDWVAPVLTSRYYAGLPAHRPPAFGLAEAQRKIHARSADQLHAAYVALGGDASPAQRRRALHLDLDPKLRDDEAVPEPLGGDAERFWAPFILVG